MVAGFEPVDLLQALAMLVQQIESGSAALANAYGRAVTAEGIPIARKLLDEASREQQS